MRNALLFLFLIGLLAYVECITIDVPNPVKSGKETVRSWMYQLIMGSDD